MLESYSTQKKKRPLGRWCWGLVASLCLVLPGCASYHLRGPNFSENELSGTAKQLYADQRNGAAFGFSNKARQIEEDFGYR